MEYLHAINLTVYVRLTQLHRSSHHIRDHSLWLGYRNLIYALQHERSLMPASLLNLKCQQWTPQVTGRSGNETQAI